MAAGAETVVDELRRESQIGAQEREFFPDSNSAAYPPQRAMFASAWFSALSYKKALSEALAKLLLMPLWHYTFTQG